MRRADDARSPIATHGRGAASGRSASDLTWKAIVKRMPIVSTDPSPAKHDAEIGG